MRPKLILFLIIICFPYSSWAMKSNCGHLKAKFNEHANKLIKKIERVEFCARPAENYRGKVFSNLKYRANRLKTCVKMVTQGKLGFNCSREFRKTLKADGGENCSKKFEVMKKSYQKYEVIFSSFQPCLKNK